MIDARCRVRYYKRIPTRFSGCFAVWPRQMEASSMVPLSARANGPKATILVVDDSPDMLRYLRLLLEIDSYQVETASNGADALRRVRQGCAPAVVLLDVQMPGMDGLKTLRRLMKLQPDLNVIMCSGVDDPAKIRRAT